MIQFARKHFTKGGGSMMVLFIKFGIFLTQIISLIGHALKSSGTEALINNNEELILYNNPAYISPEVNKLSQKIPIKNKSELSGCSACDVLFPIGNGTFKEYIEVMDLYKTSYRYRFLNMETMQVVGSDSKDTNGVVMTL